MITTWNDLPELNNIIDTVTPKKFDNKNIEDFKESVYYFIIDYFKSNIRVYEKYYFNEDVYCDIYKIIINTYGTYIIDAFSIPVDVIISECLDLYFLITDTPRSFQKTLIITEPDIEYVDSVFEKIKTKEQPEQRTDDWYVFRRNLLTASNLWKAIDSQAMKNSLIFEKCKPINKKKSNTVNINSPFHQGHKYEPLSVLMYEYLYNTKVGEFGCIRHDTIPFLGASPDGINIDRTNKRYGRLLEIKNPVSDRLLNGIPKKDYWIQMQLQMEVWCLSECDFLETRFKEYENEIAFKADGSFKKTKDGKYKGIVLQFYDGNEPVYEYPPFNISESEFEKWNDECMDKCTIEKGLSWVRNTYWFLDNYSCSLVVRNKEWFDEITPLLQELWNSVLYDRIHGYEHRKPNQRKKKQINIVKADNIEEQGINIISNEKQDDTGINVIKEKKKKKKKEGIVIKIDI